MLIFDQLKKNDPQLRMLTLTVLCGLGVLLVGLWWVQIVSSRDYQAHLETQSFRTVRIPAVRGKILDRDGHAMAENRPAYNVSLYLEELRDPFAKAYARSRPVQIVTNSSWQRWLGSGAVKTQYVKLTQEQMRNLTWQARCSVASNIVTQVSQRLQESVPFDAKRFQHHYSNSLVLPFPVVMNLNSNQIARFEEQSTSPIGVDLEVQSVRFYPCQSTAAHVLGSLKRDDTSAEGEEAFFSYRLPDYRGSLGIEWGYDKQLRGSAGSKSVLVNNVGYRQTETVWIQAEPGNNVVLTLDLYVQRKVERALQVYGPNTRGAAVVMDVQSGDILAMASSPTLDPNDSPSNLPPGEQARRDDPKLRPLINRATQENYAPGSIFKTLIGLACLEAGLDPEETVYNPGAFHFRGGAKPIKDLAAVGNYNFRQALMHSSKTYFITNGLKVGMQNIIRLGQRLHLGERTGLQTRQETAGVFPDLAKVSSNWRDGDTANFCIGQGYLSVSPLQMTVMTAAIANGGTVLWPRLVDRLESQDPASSAEPVIFPRARVRDLLGVKARSLEVVRAAMLGDVEEVGGTGTKAAVAGLRIAGKTGTAQVMDPRNHVIGDTVWFASFAPYEKPRYAVVVMVEVEANTGATGGSICAPIAHNIYKAILEREKMGVKGETLAKSD
jgi:penicillin-binding protein 2